MEGLKLHPEPRFGYRVLVVDNYDSFTYSLVQQLQLLGAQVQTRRSDMVRPADCRVELIVLSPGPGRPEEQPINGALLADPPAPIFGVCLGMQAIGQAFGGHVGAARAVVHGRTSRIYHAGRGCFRGLPCPFAATRYHSLAVLRPGLSPALEVTAWTDDGEIMGLRHRTLPIEGVQFHPESVRTRHGLALMRNVLASLPHPRSDSGSSDSGSDAELSDAAGPRAPSLPRSGPAGR